MAGAYHVGIKVEDQKGGVAEFSQRLANPLVDGAPIVQKPVDFDLVAAFGHRRDHHLIQRALRSHKSVEHAPVPVYRRGEARLFGKSRGSAC